MLNEPKEEAKDTVLSETESDEITPEAIEGGKDFANALVSSFIDANKVAN